MVDFNPLINLRGDSAHEWHANLFGKIQGQGDHSGERRERMRPVQRQLRWLADAAFAI